MRGLIRALSLIILIASSSGLAPQVFSAQSEFESTTLAVPPVTIGGEAGGGPLEISILQITGPLEDLPPTFRGNYWIGVEFQVANIGATNARLNMDDVHLLDGEGFVIAPQGRYFDSGTLTTFPEIGEMVPGTVLRGWLFYELAEGAKPAWLVLDGPYSFQVLANLGSIPATMGTPVPVFDVTATEQGTLLISDVEGDYSGDPLWAKPGYIEIGVHVTANSQTQEEFRPSASQFFVGDGTGARHGISEAERWAERAVPFEQTPVTDGYSQDFVVQFALPVASDVAVVAYESTFSSGNTRLISILAMAAAGDSLAQGPEDSVSQIPSETTCSFCADLPTSPAPVPDETGRPQAEISVLEVMFGVPFQASIDPGSEIAGVRLRVEVTGVDGYDVPYQVMALQDRYGFTYRWLNASGDDAWQLEHPMMPGNVEAGQTAEGWIYFEVARGAELSGLLIATQSAFTTLAGPLPGDATTGVAIVDGLFRPMGTVSIESVVFAVVIPNRTPEPGQQFVAVTWRISSEGGASISPGSARFYAVDDRGTVYLDMEIEPDLPAIPPGESATGKVYLQMPEGTAPRYVILYTGNRVLAMDMTDLPAPLATPLP